MVRVSAAAAALTAVLAVAACGGGDGGGPGGEATKVAYSNPVGAQPGQQDIVFGFERGARELGWEAASIDANLSPDKQVADIATMVSQGEDGIASWTLDPGAAAGAYGQAQAAGIPVVGVNSEGAGIDATVWWQLNRCGEGSPIAELADYIADEKPGAKVLAVGGPPVPSIQAYERCFAEHAQADGLEIVGEAHNTRDTAARRRAAGRRPADQAPGRRRDLGLQRRLRARRVRRAHRRRADGLRRLGRRCDRVRAERRRRRDRGDQGASAHGDRRPRPRRHRLGADQGTRRVRGGGPARRPAHRAGRPERDLDAREHRPLHPAARAPLHARHGAARRGPG